MEEYSETRHKCPVCGKHEFSCISSFEVCPVCGWMDDEYQVAYPDNDGGANNISLNEAKRHWNENQKNS